MKFELERKNHEIDELKKSVERFRSLAENAGFIIFQLSIPDGNLDYISPTCTQILGYSPEEFSEFSQFLKDIIHPDWEEEFNLTWKTFIEGKGKEVYEYQVIDRYGDIKWIHQRNVVVLDSEGNPKAVEGVVTDITARKHSEEALRESMEKYQTLFDSAYDSIFLLDNQMFIDCNEMTLKIFGCQSKDEIVGKSPWEFSPYAQPDGIDSREKAWHYILAALNGEPQRFYWKHLRKNKTAFDAEVSLNRLKFGNNYYIQAIVRDITLRKKYEDELTRLRNLLSNIVDSMPSILVAVDTEGRINEWNHKAEIVTGVTSEKAYRAFLVDVLPQINDSYNSIKKAIETKQPQMHLKVPFESNGITVYSDVVIYPLTSNCIEGAVIRIDDITERVHIEEMMIQSEKMLSVGGLAAGMAHEINNPLAGILQNIQVIKNRLSTGLTKNEQAAEACGTSMETIQCYMKERGILSMFDSVVESGTRAAQIVENMLSFSRKSDSKHTHHDIEKLIDMTVALAANDYDLKKKYDFRRIEIIREYEPKLPKIPCEGSQIQQVILNLLKNGAHAMNEKWKNNTNGNPQFILHIAGEEDMIRIEIEDNGPGMEEPVRKRVFEPFFTTKEVGVGTGLGLSVSYFIITENHKGTMTVESVLQKGTKFIIRLPKKHK